MENNMTEDKTYFSENVSEEKKNTYFNEVVEYMASDTIIPLLLEGENVIEAVRAMAGKTRPREAAPGTIRGDF